MSYFDLYHMFVLTLIISCFRSTFAALPPSISSCPNKDSEKFNSCLTDVLNSIRPNLATGDFGNGYKVQSLEPLFTEVIEIDSPELKINMSESTLLGTNKFVVTSIKSDFANLQFDIGFIAPVLNFKAKYSLHQHFKMLKVYVQAVGDISGIFKKVRSKIRVKFSVKDDLSVYLKDVQYKMKIEDAHFNIETLLVKSDETETGDGTNRVLLKQVANNFINADPDFILRKVEPKLESRFMDYLSKTIKSLFKNVKLQDFFSVSTAR